MTLETMLPVYDQQIEIELIKIDEDLTKRLTGATSELSSRGMVASGAALVQMGNCTAESLEARALMAIKLSHQCAEAARVELSAVNVEVLTTRIKEWLLMQTHLIGEKLDETPSLKRTEQQKHIAHDILQERLDLMHKKVDADFAFLMMQATATSNAVDSNSTLAPVISITGPVGVIQTGNQNIANVSQRLDEGMVEALREALASISKQLVHDSEHPDFKEAVEAAVSELSKPKPNKTILSGLMTSIKQTIEFTPKLQKFADTLAPYMPMLGLY